MPVGSLKQYGYDPGKYTEAIMQSRRRFTEDLKEGVEGIATGLTKEITGAVKEKKADARQLSQMNELINTASTVLSEIDGDMRQNSGKGLFESAGVNNSRQALEKDIGKAPSPDAGREQMKSYMDKLNKYLSGLYNSLISSGKLTSGFYDKSAGILSSIGIDPSTGQKTAREREFALSEDPTMEGAIKQGVDISSPVVKEGIGRGQMQNITPDMTSAQAISVTGGTPVGGAAAMTKALPTEYQKRQQDLYGKAIEQRKNAADAAAQRANEKAEESKKSEVQKQRERELSKIRSDINTQTSLMNRYDAVVAKVEPEYMRLKRAIKELDNGEATPAEFKDKDGNPYKSEDALRGDFRRLEREYSKNKAAANKAYDTITALSEKDTSISGQIKAEIANRAETEQKQLEGFKRMQAAIEKIVLAEPVEGSKALNELTSDDIANMLRQTGQLSDEEIDAIITGMKNTGESIQDVYGRVNKFLTKYRQ